MTHRKNSFDTGFTLVEIMIVVTIIAIIATIAIPNLLRAKLQANESSAIQSLRAILSAQGAYHAANLSYATTMEELVGAEPPFLDHDFLAEPLAGYTFAFGGDENNYTVNADPVSWGITGGRGFYTDASGVIRQNVGASADNTSPPI